MGSLNSAVSEYTAQLKKGELQKAYRGILAFMSGLGRRLEGDCPGCCAGSLYPGLMDMSYFSFTPPELRDGKLKIAIVYLHAQNRLEIWLGGINRKVQAETMERLSRRDLGKYKLTTPAPGVDSILEAVLMDHPDFDRTEVLYGLIRTGVTAFIRDMLLIAK